MASQSIPADFTSFSGSRWDIHDLASGMDDVIDGINSCAKRITIYNPHPISDKGKELGHMVQQEAALIGSETRQLTRH